MRFVLVLGLVLGLLSLCALPPALRPCIAPNRAGPLAPRPTRYTPKGYTVPGWTDEQTRQWLSYRA